MTGPKQRLLKYLFVFMSLVLGALATGCQEDNNAEFMRSAPPGEPLERPNESYAQRKERTRELTPELQRAEQRAKAEADAKAKPKAKSTP